MKNCKGQGKTFKEKEKNCSGLRKRIMRTNRMVELKSNTEIALTAWKAVRSVATVTGDEVLGRAMLERCAWKALRQRTLRLAYCLPGRILTLAFSEDFVPGYQKASLL